MVCVDAKPGMQLLGLRWSLHAQILHLKKLPGIWLWFEAHFRVIKHFHHHLLVFWGFQFRIFTTTAEITFQSKQYFNLIETYTVVLTIQSNTAKWL